MRSSDRTPGEVTVPRLHALVPAAEALDCLEELEREQAARWARELERLQALAHGLPVPADHEEPPGDGEPPGDEEPPGDGEPPGDDDPAGDPADEPTPSPGQALGLLVHELGATPVQAVSPHR